MNKVWFGRNVSGSLSAFRVKPFGSSDAMVGWYVGASYFGEDSKVLDSYIKDSYYDFIKPGELWERKEITWGEYCNHLDIETDIDFVVKFAPDTKHERCYRWRLVDTLGKCSDLISDGSDEDLDDHIRKIVTEELDKREKPKDWITYEKLKRLTDSRQLLRWFKNEYPDGVNYYSWLKELCRLICLSHGWPFYEKLHRLLLDHKDELCQ
jgi:hypothetical protein